MFSRAQRLGIIAHEPFDFGRQSGSLRGAQFAPCGGQIAEQRLHPCELDADARGIGFFIENLAQQDGGVARPIELVGEHQREPETRLGPQFDIGIFRQRAIGGFGGDEIAFGKRAICKRE